VADLIAVAVVAVMGQCGGVIIPFRAGRKDATEPNNPGVPKPQDPFEMQLQAFQKAGLNQSQMITLVGCAHSLGGVHSLDFPDIVPDTAITPNNTSGAENFDETSATFDQGNLMDYIHGTGNKGGPMVTTSNATFQSDLRIFNSDGNKTVAELATTSLQNFLQTCGNNFATLSNLVPRGVQLTENISPIAVKPLNVTLDLDIDGNTLLLGTIRVRLPLKRV
jgi:hypothetical protein